MYWGLSSCFQFDAILNRLGDVFKLDEIHKQIQDNVPPEEVGIQFTDASFSWGY
jgi:hypothetical protein